MRSVSFSVVICTLRNFDGLRACIDSIFAQTLPPAQLIVVHAGSDEGVERYVTGLSPLHPECDIVYRKAQPSLVVQRNIGIDAASRDVVFFIDDDAVLDASYFSEVMKYYSHNWDQNLGGVQGTVVNYKQIRENPNTLFRKLFFLSSLNGRGILRKSGYPSFLNYAAVPTSVEVFNGCMMSFKREILQKERFDLNLKDHWWGDDFDVSYRISRNHRLVQIPSALMFHEGSSISNEGLLKFWRMKVANRDYFFRKFFAHNPLNWFYYYAARVGEILLVLNHCRKSKSLNALRGFREGMQVANKRLAIEKDRGGVVEGPRA